MIIQTVVSIFLLFFPIDCTTIADGNYNNPAIWSCGIVPDSTKNIKIAHVVNVTQNQSCKNMEQTANGRLNFTGNYIFKIKGN